MQWLVASVVASVILTVVLNVAVRAFPRASDRLARVVADRTSPNEPHKSRVRVIVPWKAMLLASIVVTVVINAWLRLR